MSPKIFSLVSIATLLVSITVLVFVISTREQLAHTQTYAAVGSVILKGMQDECKGTGIYGATLFPRFKDGVGGAIGYDCVGNYGDGALIRSWDATGKPRP